MIGFLARPHRTSSWEVSDGQYNAKTFHPQRHLL
jgi:hypothetical protein